MYELLDIELLGFHGLKLNNIRRFKLKFTTRVTLFLGRNGSGKTRVTRQMHALSIQRKEYRDGGGKITTFKFNNVVYRAESMRQGNSVKNTLFNVTDNVAIHKDVNPTYHDEVIRNLTGWSLELHRMVVDHEQQITKMRGPDRKYWFGKLSESDLAYGLKFYNKLREHVRDLKGAFKNVTNEISELSTLVIDGNDEFVKISEAMERLKDTRDRLESKRNRIASDRDFKPDMNVDKLARAYEDLAKVSELILKFDPALTGGEGIDRDTLVAQLAEHQYAAREAMRRVLEVQNIIDDAVSVSEGASANELREWIERDNETIRLAEARIHFKEVAESPRVIKTDYDRIMKAYSDVSGERPERITHDHANELMQDANNIAAKLGEIKNFINQAEGHINHYDHAETSTCPKCEHKYVAGYPAEKIDNLRVRVKEAYFTKKQFEVMYEDAVAKYKEMVNWLNRINNFNDELTRIRDINVVDYVILSRAEHNAIPSIVEQLKADWDTLALVLETKAARDALNVRLSAVVEHGKEWLEARQQELEVARTEYNYKYGLAEIVNAKIVAYDKWHDDCDKEFSLKQDLDICYGYAEQSTKSYYLTVEHEEIVSALRHVCSTLEETSARYYALENNRRQLEQLKSQAARITKELEVSTELLTAMGPEEGLLAKHLYRSISRVTDMMNDIIRRVWGYNIEILPCAVDKGELNYKFPYIMGDDGEDPDREQPEDLSEASAGQRRLFDLIFVLSFYALSNLDGYPLFLDEPFSGFDEGHQDKCIKYINHSLESGKYSQLIMISHDPEVHFQLSQASYVVIDPDGISLPSVYNQNVEMD